MVTRDMFGMLLDGEEHLTQRVESEQAFQKQVSWIPVHVDWPVLGKKQKPRHRGEKHE